MAELSVNDIIRISTSIAPTGLVRRETGRTLFLTDDQTIPAEERVRAYSSLAGVGADFDVNSNVYKGAQVYFSQSPFPRNFLVGTKYPDDGQQVPANILGEVLTAQGQSDISLVSDANIEIEYDLPSIAGETINAGPINLVGFSMDQVATTLTAELQNSEVSCTVTWDEVASRFGIEISYIGATPTDYIVDATVTNGGTPTNIGELMNLDAVSGGVTTAGALSSAETVAEALDAIVNIDPSFSFVCEDPNLSDTSAVTDIANWCLANRAYIAVSASAQANVIGADPSGTLYEGLHTDQNPNAVGVWSATADYKHVSLAGRMSSINFAQSNALITPMYKQLPTCDPDTALTFTEVSRLDDLNVNRYVTRSGVPMFETGKTFSNDWWMDSKYWTIWFENSVLTEVFNLLYGSGKVPQTSQGQAQLEQVIEKVCEQGVANGGIAGGQLSDAITNDIRQTTGNGDFDGYLARGYYIYSEPIANQPQSERVQRKGPPIKVWLKGSGAIHEVDIAVLFEQ